MPHFDPGDRIEITVPTGRTIAEILRVALPDAAPDDLLRCRVVLVTPAGAEAIEPKFWGCVRPRPGVRVVIRVIPGKSALRSVLAIVVSIAAVALGAMYGLGLGTALGFTGTTAQMIGAGLIGMAVTAIGTLAINALIPVDDLEAENRYSISGWRNTPRPDGVVPLVMGRIRWAPPFAALSYTEIVGDFMYVRAVFCLGYGELEVSDLWIGETPIEEYDEVTTEIRTGAAGDDPISLYPQQIAEQSVGVEIQRPLNRDDLGEVTSGSTLKPVVRTTGDDAAGASCIFCWTGGLVKISDGGDKRSQTVEIKIEYRLDDGVSDWVEETTLKVTAKKLEMFWRQYTWQFPVRGRYDVRVTMLTEETTKTSVQRDTTWAALQTLRPEYPLAMDGIALIGVRIKATYQLQGTLDTVTAMVSRVCLDWDAATQSWIKRATRRPASLARYILQAAGNAKPCTDARIDLDAFADWHDFCVEKGLEFNEVFEDSSLTVGAALQRVAAAGRASIRWTGTRYTVIIDRPRDLIVDHIGPRNSRGFKVSRKYFRAPDGQRVRFLDETNDYKPAERFIPWPGNDTGARDTVEEVSRPGKTSPVEIWRETRRRMYETMHRPDIYQVTQDGAARVATRGDLVALSHYVLDGRSTVARVRAVTGAMIQIDEALTIQEGVNYGIRFRIFDAADTIGTSEHRAVEIVQAERPALLRLTGSGPVPGTGDLVHFGVLGEETVPAIVTGIEPGQDLSVILTLADAAPQIDEIIDAEEVPEWSGRVGAVIDMGSTIPAVPVIASISSEWDETPFSSAFWNYWVIVSLTPGHGSAVQIARYEVDWRLSGASSWTTISAAVTNGGIQIDGHRGDAIEVRARALTAMGVASSYTNVVALTIGASDPALPAELDPESIDITALLGGVSVAWAVSDPDTTAVQIYRSTTAMLDREADAVGTPVAVSAGQSYQRILGADLDNRVLGSALSDAGPWTAGLGWSISGGIASHSAGDAGALAQDIDLLSGRSYRIAITVSGRTAGTVTACLAGGIDRIGTAIGTNGRALDRITSAAGNTALEIRASADFDGSVDDVTLYLETESCLSQGNHYIWLEAQNADGLGTISGPFTVEII
ncbi:phage tail protein [Sinirhodobacter ferrireducens]|uniref:Phage tail protein n=2 Tax=Paenirhodobacter ferrireducens TaxID=1215032 RepID=A0A443LNB4_9RHOB|nr:phage tail protein [Sinirhodobacter ferrireducens]